MNQLDFCIATDFEYDVDFMNLLEDAARRHGLSTYIVWPYNLSETLRKLNKDEMAFNFFYDRASDSSPRFLKLHGLMLEKQVPMLDSMSALKRASDKATMHLEFIANGLMTPYTIIIPPYDTLENIYLSVADLAKLGRPFFIKPANTTGGGMGVVAGAETLQDVLLARQKFQADKYLIQEKVMPQERDGKRFWFRGFYVCGEVECTWWHDHTHVYEILSGDDIKAYKLQPLFRIIKKIAEISQLQFFSTEIALNDEDKFVIVDYVNEICDMRVKSRHYDGVPDEIVAKVASTIVTHVKKQIKDKAQSLSR